LVRRLDLKRCGAVNNGIGVNGGNGGNIGRRRRANVDLLHRETKLPEKKSPRNMLKRKRPGSLRGVL
jgi:hypothetical protein